MQRRDSARRRLGFWLALAWTAGAAGGCFQNDGKAPPSGVLNFPIAMTAKVLDPLAGPRFLYVANSNFDLRYRGAMLQSFDLEVVDQALASLCAPVLPPPGCRGPIPAACAADPAGAACAAITKPAHTACAFVPSDSPQAELDPGLLRICGIGEGGAAPGPLLVDEVEIGSFADGIAIAPSGDRLYLPVRSDADVTRVSLDASGRFDCGGGFGTSTKCTSAFRDSDRSVAEARGLTLPPDPVAMAVGPLSDFPGHTADEGDYVVLTHRAGEMSYFLAPATGPELSLIDVLEGFPLGMAKLVREPDTGFLWAPSTRGSVIARVGVSVDESVGPDELEESFLFDAGPLTVRNVDLATQGDLRDVAFDPRPGIERAYLLSRSPTALLVGERAPSIGVGLSPSFDVVSQVSIGAGPSNLQLAELTTASGPRLFAFITCYDARSIYIVDVDLGRVVTVAPELSGPYEFVLDAARERLYVIDFRTSVIRIVSLTPTLACLSGAGVPSTEECPPALVGMIGVPDAAEELE